jgi:hypothetical protein
MLARIVTIEALSEDAESRRSTAVARPRPRRWLPVLCVLLLLAGCGTQFLYNRLDTLLYLYVSTQVSLEGGQSRELKVSLGQFLDWHRRAELPRYASFAEDLARDASQPLGRERIDGARLQIESLWRDAVQRGAPEAAGWLATLSRAQVDELFQALAEDDGDYREEFCEGSDARRLERRQRTFIRSAENWVGRLDAQQKELARERLARLAPTGCSWVEQRITVRDEFRRLVTDAAAEADYARRVTQLLMEPEARWDPRYRRAFDENRDRVVDLLVALDATLTPRQRTTLQRTLREFAQDFRQLSAAPVTASAGPAPR